MKNNKKIIIELILIVIAIVVIILVVNRNKKPPYEDPIEVEVLPPEEVQSWQEKENKILPVANMNDVIEIKSCLETYYNAKYNDRVDSKSTVFNCLSPMYITSKGISEDSIMIESSNIEYDSYVEIYSSYLVTRNNNTDLFYVSGLVRNKKSYESRSFNLAIVKDLNNHTFEILPEDFFEEGFFNTIESGTINSYDYNNEVSNRIYNTYTSVSMKSDMFYQIMFNNVRSLLSYDMQNAYRYLNKEAGSINSLESLKNFYNDNKKEIFMMGYGSSQVESGSDNSSFKITCFDKNDAIYITFFMDGYGKYTYTIDTL